MIRSAKLREKMESIIKTPAIIFWNKKFQPIDLYDVITLRKLNERKIQLKKTSGYKIPTNALNPVFQVAAELQSRRPTKFGISIEIEKNIPTNSGFSSRLSNAASTLLALNRLWKFDLNKRELLAIAKKVDPHMEKMLKWTPFAKQPKYVLLIRPKHITIDPEWAQNKKLYDFFPDLKVIEKEIQNLGATEYGITSNGPTIFGFFDKKPNAENIQKKLKDKINFIWSGNTCNEPFKLLN